MDVAPLLACVHGRHTGGHTCVRYLARGSTLVCLPYGYMVTQEQGLRLLGLSAHLPQ
jgi:hypothetical protein